jgi:hypothetical protein
VIDRDGKKLRDLPAGSDVTCLAVASDGAIYAGKGVHVDRLTADGTPADNPADSRWGKRDEKAIITSIAVTGDAVFVADAGNKIVRRYDREGKRLGTIGEKNENKGVRGFVLPSAHLDVAVGADSLVRVNNPGRLLVETFSADGEWLGAWGEAGMSVEAFCGCCNPTDLALLADGSVVTSEKGLLRVKVYSPNGQFDSLIIGSKGFPPDRGTGTTAASTPKEVGLDLAVDADGRVLVLDPVTARIRVFMRK